MELDELLALAKRWPVFPCHFIDRGGCSCGEKCPSPGKHPMTIRGVDDASQDPDRVVAWHRRTPGANWGIATGGESRLIVLDVDPRNGGDGALRELSQKYGELPDCPTVKTGGEGWHYYMRSPAGWDCKNSSGKIGGGLDIKTTGGYVMAPGCSHYSGRSYYWDEGEGLEPPEMPAWLMAIIEGSQKKRVNVDQDKPKEKIKPGNRHEWVLMLTRKLQESGIPVDAIVSSVMSTAEKDLDLSDGRKISRDEVERAARGAAAFVEPIDFALCIRGKEIAENMLKIGVPKPKPIKQATLPKHLFDGLKGPLKMLWEYAMHAPRPQPELALGAALSTFGAVFAGKIETDTGLRTNVYMIGVCDSGGGKDEPRKACKRALDAAGLGSLIGSDSWASSAALHSMLQAGNQRICYADEFGKIIAAINDNKASSHLREIPRVLLTLTGSANTKYHAIAYADASKTIEIMEPHLCIFGTTTHSTLFGALTRESFEDGLLARCLILGVANQLPQMNHDFRPILPEKQLVESIKKWRKYTGSSLSGITRLTETPEARQMLIEYSDACDDKKRHSKDDLASIWTRCKAKASIIASIFAAGCHWPDSPEIPMVDEEAVKWAIDFVNASTEYTLTECRANIAETTHERTVVDIEKTIRRGGPGGIPLNQLKAEYRKVPHKVLIEIIRHGMESGKLEIYKKPTGKRGAPPDFVRLVGPAEIVETEGE